MAFYTSHSQHLTSSVRLGIKFNPITSQGRRYKVAKCRSDFTYQVCNLIAMWAVVTYTAPVNSLTTVGYLLEVFIRLWIPSMARIFTSPWS